MSALATTAATVSSQDALIAMTRKQNQPSKSRLRRMLGAFDTFGTRLAPQANPTCSAPSAAPLVVSCANTQDSDVEATLDADGTEAPTQEETSATDNSGATTVRVKVEEPQTSAPVALPARAPRVEASQFRVYPTEYRNPDAPRDRDRFVCEIEQVRPLGVPAYWIVKAGRDQLLTIGGSWVRYLPPVDVDVHAPRYRFVSLKTAQNSALRHVDEVTVDGHTLDEHIKRGRTSAVQVRPHVKARRSR